MKLIPYLTFDGNCEEALTAYQKIFNGKIGHINRYDTPDIPVPEDYKYKIMHTELSFGDNRIMFTDAVPGRAVEYGNGYSLSIELTDIVQTKKIFNNLADNGDIIVPLEKQFWGSWFGQVTDRFGISWMLMCEDE